MSQLNTHISRRQLEKIILDAGWVCERSTGPHAVYGLPGNKVKIAIPNKHGKDIAEPIVRKALRIIDGTQMIRTFANR